MNDISEKEESIEDDNNTILEANEDDDINNDIENEEVENKIGDIDLMGCLYDDDNDIEMENNGIKEELLGENRMSYPILTKYERVRILTARTKQLTLGAPNLVKNVLNKSPLEIAEIELNLNMIPFKIKRNLPNNKYEIWRLSELEK